MHINVLSGKFPHVHISIVRKYNFRTSLHLCVFFSPSSKRHEENLALPSSEKQALECTKAGVETWEYKAKNALMYYPEGKD